MAAGGTLIRIPRTSPSVFSTPDDEHFIPACMNNFRSRDREDVSLWLLPDDPTERKRVLAAFAGRRSKAQTLSYLELQDDWFERLSIEPRQVEDCETFDCVGRFHYEIRQPDEETLHSLAVEIQSALLQTPHLFQYLRTPVVRQLLQKAHATCQGEGGPAYDVGKLPRWAVELLE